MLSMQVIAVAAQKGGSGKTTLAGHLAVQAERAGAGPVAVIDTDANSLTYSNGGQYPYPIFKDEQGVRFLDAKALPVGLFSYAEFQTLTMPLPETFTVAMFSDGVLEILPQQTLGEQKAFLLSLFENADLSMEKLVAELGLESTGAPADDVTLLLAKKGSFT